MNLLENEIDCDSLISSLMIKSVYTDLFTDLLINLKSENLSKLVISHLSKMLSDLKYIIKFKLSRLKPKVRDNIFQITLLLLNYSINVDTLILNLLRHGYNKFPLKHKYFKVFTNAVPFIKYHLGEEDGISNQSICSTLISYEMELDIYFMSTVPNNIRFYIDAFLKKYSTKKDYILKFINLKKISGNNIELLINSMNNKKKSTRNSKKFKKSNKQALSNEVIDWHGMTEHSTNLTEASLKEAGKNESVEDTSRITVEGIGKVQCVEEQVQEQEDTNKICSVEDTGRIESVEDTSRIESVEGTKDEDASQLQSNNARQPQITNASQNLTSKEAVKQNEVFNDRQTDSSLSAYTHQILHQIAELSFSGYYALLQDMKNNNTVFIPSSAYRSVIMASYGYDNYVQVYLWKILVFQKIIFDTEIEIEESELKTLESLEGYDVYLNIH